MISQNALLASGEILTEVFESEDIAEITLEYLNWLKDRGDTIRLISKDCYFRPSEYGFGYEVVIAYSKIGDPKTGRL